MCNAIQWYYSDMINDTLSVINDKCIILCLNVMQYNNTINIILCVCTSCLLMWKPIQCDWYY